jgi:hypothetical protein
VRQHLEQFESACPESVRAFPSMRWSQDPTSSAVLPHASGGI